MCIRDRLRHVPRAVVAVLLRDFRVNIRVKAVAIVKALGFEHCIVRDEFQRHLPHLIGNRRHIQKLFVRNRLCLCLLYTSHDPELRVVVQIAPAVRVALGEAFGLASGVNVLDKMVATLKLMGADEVYDCLLYTSGSP